MDFSGADVAGTDADTRRRILEAGMDCLATSGSAKTSVQNVAAAAGLSRATLYRYFGDRNGLVRAIRHYEHESFSATVRDRLRSARTLQDAVAILAEVAAARVFRYRGESHQGGNDHALVVLTRPSPDLVRTLIGPFIDYAEVTGQLVAGVTTAQATDWISLCLSTVYWLPDSGLTDLGDPALIGAYYAERICAGIASRDHRN